MRLRSDPVGHAPSVARGRLPRLAAVAALFALTVTAPALAQAPAPSGAPAPAASGSAAAAGSAAPGRSAAPSGPAAPVAAASGSGRVDSPPPPGSEKLEPCRPDVVAWAEEVSARSDMKLTPVSCPEGLVRVRLASGAAPFDFEITSGGGFAQTMNGKFGVSPVGDLEWSRAPDEMARALAAIVEDLDRSPTLVVPTGPVVRRVADEAHEPMRGAFGPSGRGWSRAGRRRAAIAAAVVALAAMAGGLWARRRRKAPRAAAPDGP